MNHITQLVTEGYNLHLKIELLKEKLREIESTLKQEANLHINDHIPLKSKLSRGSQWIIQAEQCEARVITTDARLKESFPWNGKETERIKGICSGYFENLFEPVWHFIPIHQFRKKAIELLGNDSQRLIKICTRTSTQKILWKEK